MKFWVLLVAATQTAATQTESTQTESNLDSNFLSSNFLSNFNSSSLEYGSSSGSGKAYQPRRLRTDLTIVVASSSILAAHSPQECLAGRYCAGRAGSVSGTAACPTGFFCPSGSVTPQAAPPGQFVGLLGSVRAYDCASGTFAPYLSLPYCLPCPPGFSCVLPGTTTPALCAAGTYRESFGSVSLAGTSENAESASLNSISCKSCPEGTFSQWRGAPDQTSCEPCPSGRICLAKTANITATNPCAEGYMCGDGTTLSTSSAHLCFSGFVCPKSTTPESVYGNLCGASFVCKSGTTFADQFRVRCPVGFYCPEGSPWLASMEYPLQPGVAYLGRAEFAVLQVVGQYCLRQLMVTEVAAVMEENQARLTAGLDEITPDQQATRISSWVDSLTSCVLDQVENLPLLTKTPVLVGDLVDAHLEWHASQLLKLVPGKRADEYSNKCDEVAFPRNDESTVWGCFCAQTGAELMQCLTTSSADDAVVRFGAIFDLDSLADLDAQAQCSNWPDCLDWTRLDDYSGVLSHSSGPSTGPAVDDFDALAVTYIDYVAAALMRNALLFASQTSKTQCPFGTISAADGLSSVEQCEKRFLVSALGDPDDIIIARINPINRPVSTSTPRRGNTVKNEEDMRFVFPLKARAFATISIDFRDLPPNVEYGRDWRVAFFVDHSLSAESNDPQRCNEIWTEFLNAQFQAVQETLPTEFSASKRQSLLDTRNCTLLANPFSFEAFQYSTGSLCPADDAQCYFRYQAPSYFSPSECNPDQLQVRAHEFYLHAIVDVEFRVEIQILNGLYLPERFKFIRAVGVDIREPSRAELGTTKAFVVEFNSGNAQEVYFPYNLPQLPEMGSEAESAYSSQFAGTVDGKDAISQRAIMTKAYLSWLPRDTATALSNCFSPTNAWDEFLYSQNYFSAHRTAVYQTHLPFFSNCRGFGRAIPLWHAVETHPSCDQVSQEDTVSVTEISFGGKSVGDTCSGVELECLVDEIPNSKQSIPRWFEAVTGVELFRISANAMSADEYANLDESENPISKSIPVTLRQGSLGDGTWLRQVDLNLRYWQQSSTTKVITTANVEFSKFERLTDAQSKGKSPWSYTLRVSWSPMSHIEVFNSYSFGFFVYLVFALVMGGFSVAIVIGHWSFHYMLSPMRTFATKLSDKRYWRLLVPAQLKGFLLALIPATLSLFAFLICFQGETSAFTISLYTCDTTDPLGCRISILDSMLSSWSGESPSSPNSYATRRNGRAALLFILLGSYLVLISMKAFIPQLVSHYYDSAADEEEEEEEPDRSWPPDQQIFSPLVWKRSSWFLLIASNCLICTLLIEFSYSLFFTELWWLYIIGFYLLGKAISTLVLWIMNEELLRVPIIAVYQTILQVVTLGSPDYYSFIVTVFITQAIFLLDRLYVTPNERIFGKEILRGATSMVKRVKLVLGGGRLEAGGESEPLSSASSVPTHAGEEQQLSSAERAHADGMLYFLANYNANLMSALLTPILLALFALMYTPTQALNYYDVAPSEAKFYFGFQLVMFLFRYLTDVISLNTAELYHEWKLLDYLEYCKYRFSNRPSRWKGANEVSDELITPELRSLDLFCFSSQFYFSSFLSALGGILLLVGMQVTVNNAWNIFDDQASPFIIIGGLALLGILRFAYLTAADYLKIWFVDTADAEERAEDVAFEESLRLVTLGEEGKEQIVKAPFTSALFNWPEPSLGDKSGWERFRMAYLRENQLWLQAHMDILVDGPTSVEYRRLLMESLSRILKESNILELSKPKGVAADSRALELNALPPHVAAVRAVAESRRLFAGTAVEAAAAAWFARGRFLRFLKMTVAEIELDQGGGRVKAACEVCALTDELSVAPAYPVAYVADQYRIQRNMNDIFNVPLWQHFYKTFTPACTLCLDCRLFFSDKNVAIPIGQGRPDREAVAASISQYVPEPRSLEEVLRDSPYRLVALNEASVGMLSNWLHWAETLAGGGAEEVVDVCENPILAIENAEEEEPEIEITEASRAVLVHWLLRARQLTSLT